METGRQMEEYKHKQTERQKSKFIIVTGKKIDQEYLCKAQAGTEIEQKVHYSYRRDINVSMELGKADRQTDAGIQTQADRDRKERPIQLLEKKVEWEYLSKTQAGTKIEEKVHYSYR